MSALAKTFVSPIQTRELFKDVSFICRPGKRMVVTGPSGVGKSTLLLMIAGIEEPSAGTVFYCGAKIPILGMSEHEIFLRDTLGLMFQYPHLVPEFSVLENVMVKGLAAGNGMDICRSEGMALLERVGLAHCADRSPSFLSGGEQQRVALARALFLKPAYLIADEPTAHLDAANAELIFDLISAYQKEGMGVLMSSHDPLALKHADDVVLLRDGSLTYV